MKEQLHPGWPSLLSLLFCAAAAVACAPSPDAVNHDIILLSTTTTRDTGLLDVLVPDFQNRSGYNVKTIIAGSGEILKLGERGEGDVVLAHSLAAEERWIAAGHGTGRTLVMHNDFVVVGSPTDPASVKGLGVADALRRIADRKALFISRGDQSGTNVKELSLWTVAGAAPKGQAWYLETGAGQGQTLNVASEKQGYALTDRGTYLALRKNLALDIFVEREPDLLNIYHVMLVNPAKSTKINAVGAKAFADYLASPDAQSLIRTYGVAQYGQALFVPDAGKTDEQVMAGH